MVIIPTEKRFDWSKPPIILFCLVLMNVLIFFFYQDDDEKKINQALTQYGSLNYFETEWPMYISYLKEEGSGEIATYQQMHDQGQLQVLSLYLLADQQFFDYLRYNQVRFQEPGNGEYWIEREQLNDLVSSSSIYGYGLKPKSPTLTSLITHQFLHGDIFHLMGNMFFLVIFGFAVEAAIGHLRFLLFYLLAGLAGGVLFTVVNASSPSALVGASGAISGVMAMYLGVFRLRKIEFFYWFFVFVGFFRAPALAVLPLYIANELYNFFTQSGSNVAFMAHTGGFIAGAVLILTTVLVSPKSFDEQYLEDDEEIPQTKRELHRIYQMVGKFSYDTALKAIDEYQTKNGVEFDLCWLRYLIHKERGDSVVEIQSALELLRLERLKPSELKKIERIWKDTPATHEQLSTSEVIELGWRITKLDSLKTAEAIFTYLYSQGVKTQEMSHFARKLSVIFGEKEHDAKCKRYAKAADEIFERTRQF